MFIIYGAGENFKILVKKAKWIVEKAFMVVDTNPEKYPNGVYGFPINDNSIIRKMCEDDIVYVTSEKYFDEINNIIFSLNQSVSVYKFKDLNKLDWTNYKLPLISDYVNRKNNYTFCIKEDAHKWIELAIADEIGYWENRLKNAKERKDYRLYEREFIYPYNKEIKFKKSDIILDVGSGPLPKYGNKINGDKLNYIPVDPLAYQYAKLIKEYDIELPVNPKFAIMEALTCFYKENSADYVIVNNALDHSIDILCSFFECLKVVKIGGYFLLEHMEAEGFHNNYSGLHKWNITYINNDLIFFNNSMKINVSELIEDFCDIELKREKVDYRDMIIIKIHKRKAIPVEIVKSYNSLENAGIIISNLFKKLLS